MCFITGIAAAVKVVLTDAARPTGTPMQTENKEKSSESLCVFLFCTQRSRNCIERYLPLFLNLHYKKRHAIGYTNKSI